MRARGVLRRRPSTGAPSDATTARPRRRRGRAARVNHLTARPALELFYPQLAQIRQPLAGEVAARRELLVRLPFATGYGVEIAMLIDAWRAVGVEAIAQVDLDVHHNRHQPLSALSPMALTVLATIARRLERDGRLRGLDEQVAAHAPLERPPLDDARRARAVGRVSERRRALRRVRDGRRAAGGVRRMSGTRSDALHVRGPRRHAAGTRRVAAARRRGQGDARRRASDPGVPARGRRGGADVRSPAGAGVRGRAPARAVLVHLRGGRLRGAGRRGALVDRRVCCPAS